MTDPFLEFYLKKVRNRDKSHVGGSDTTGSQDRRWINCQLSLRRPSGLSLAMVPNSGGFTLGRDCVTPSGLETMRDFSLLTVEF